MLSKLLPLGPLLMVNVCGGAERTKCSAAQTSTPQISTAGTKVCAKAHRETLPCLDGSRLESLVLSAMRMHEAAETVGIMHDCPGLSQPRTAHRKVQYFVTNDIR